MEKLVSVIIPTYNRAQVLLGAINSALSQTYKNLEIIVVDDASADNTRDLICGIHDGRVKYCRLEKNNGGSVARNVGIKISQGEFIAFLDSDDEWLPTKLEKQVKLFNSLSDEYGLIYSGCYFSCENKFSGGCFKPKEKGTIFDILLERNCVGTTSTVLVKANLVHKIGGFKEGLPSCQDWDFYLRLSQITKFYFIADSLVVYSVNKKLERISNKKDEVELGYDYIESTYAISSLSACKLGAYFYYKGIFYLYFLDYKLGAVRNFIKSILISGRLKYYKGFLLIIRKMLLRY
ncbi:MAG: glycosyltransferase [Candidatus Omnitrophota bacterium]